MCYFRRWDEVRHQTVSLLAAFLSTGREKPAPVDLQNFVAFQDGFDKLFKVVGEVRCDARARARKKKQCRLPQWGSVFLFCWGDGTGGVAALLLLLLLFSWMDFFSSRFVAVLERGMVSRVFIETPFCLTRRIFLPVSVTFRTSFCFFARRSLIFGYSLEEFCFIYATFFAYRTRLRNAPVQDTTLHDTR